MKLSEFKHLICSAKGIVFQLESGELIPSHFHITEVGTVTKLFIDCGGTVRKEEVINLQLWHSNDLNHKLNPEKLLSIISLSEETLNIQDLEIEIEYQSDTIGKYNIDYNGNEFVLIAKTTNCLAEDECGIPKEKSKLALKEIQNNQNNCIPGNGCC